MTDKDAALELETLAVELNDIKPLAARAARQGAQALRDRAAGPPPKPKEESHDERVPRLR